MMMMKLQYAIDNNLPTIPADNYIKFNGSCLKYPYGFVGDDAFTVKTYMIKRYPDTSLCQAKVIFNHRLSCARKGIKNTFGSLPSRFHIFQKSCYGGNYLLYF